ncbi:MAG: hypothetical protein ACI83P_000422 [Janthinobacterium sp.]|jgi:hypothetical protein
MTRNMAADGKYAVSEVDWHLDSALPLALALKGRIFAALAWRPSWTG